MTSRILPVRFYRSESGDEPVGRWLERLSNADRELMCVDIATVAFGWPAGMSEYRSIAARRGLWEMRRSLSEKRLGRILICRVGNDVVLLHAFVKDASETPETDLDLAVKRQQEIEHGGKEDR